MTLRGLSFCFSLCFMQLMHLFWQCSITKFNSFMILQGFIAVFFIKYCYFSVKPKSLRLNFCISFLLKYCLRNPDVMSSSLSIISTHDLSTTAFKAVWFFF